MSSLPQLIQASFAPLFGKPCWQVRRGYGSFLTFEFGEPHLEIREPREVGEDRPARVQELFARRRVFVHGEWHLWIYCCDWIVTQRGERVGESSTHERMDRAAAVLDGQALVQVERDATQNRWFFDFDLGGRLETRPYEEPANCDEHWHLYEPSGYVLTVRRDGSYQYGRGDSHEKEYFQSVETSATSAEDHSEHQSKP